MDLKFQSSFIPKQPVVMQGAGPSHVSIVYLLSIIIFIVTLGLGGAAFISKRMVEKNIGKLGGEINEAQQSFEVGTIKELQKINGKLVAAKNILDKHVAFSRFLDVLGNSTYASVSFSDFTFGDSKNGGLNFTASGIASSFNSLILQKELLRDSSEIKGAEISDFDVDENSKITFRLKASIDPQIISYMKHLPKN